MSEQEKEPEYRIRKLTPRECFRLMDVSEEDIDKIQAAGISKSRQYMLAGNSIVVSCLVEIFRQMFRPVYIDDAPASKTLQKKKHEPVAEDDDDERQLYLFEDF